MPRTTSLNHSDPTVGVVDATQPLIDAKDLSDESWMRLLRETRASCRDQGFLTLRLSETQQQVFARMLVTMRRFFSLEHAAKARSSGNGKDHGWSPCFAEPAYQPGTVANLESFDIDRSLAESADDAVWPQVTGFRAAALDCWTLNVELGALALELLARTHGVTANFFKAHCRSQELNTMRLLHYPEEQFRVPAHEVGIAAHTDFECITLLYQAAPGLEVRDPKGSWRDVEAGPDRLNVLFGDMLETWTNGEVQATGHRVRRTTDDRYSIVMFIAVDADVPVTPLARFVTPERPAQYEETEQCRHIEAEMARARANTQ